MLNLKTVAKQLKTDAKKGSLMCREMGDYLYITNRHYIMRFDKVIPAEIQNTLLQIFGMQFAESKNIQVTNGKIGECMVDMARIFPDESKEEAATVLPVTYRSGKLNMTVIRKVNEGGVNDFILCNEDYMNLIDDADNKTVGIAGDIIMIRNDYSAIGIVRYRIQDMSELRGIFK